MRILFANERLGYFGGVEQNVALTAAALRDRGHACHLAYGMTTGRDEAAYAQCFDSCHACDAGKSLSDIVSDMAPDVVYVHKAPSIAPFARLQGRCRVVRMVHDHDLCCPRSYKYYAWNGAICRHPAGWRCWLDAAFIARDRNSRARVRWVNVSERIAEMRENYGLDALLVGSRFMRDELLQNGFAPERVHIVPPCVRDAQGPVSPVPDTPTILYVGQFLRGKGVDLLLRALAQLRQPFLARLVGAGNAEGSLRALSSKLGIDDRVSFVGWVDNRHLESLYQWARVVAVPSRWAEPFGMVGIEAMQRARPVVAFEVGGIPDWLRDGETGLLVAHLTPDALARSLERILGDYSLAKTLGEGGHAFVTRQFGFECYVACVEGHLSGLDTRTGSAG